MKTKKNRDKKNKNKNTKKAFIKLKCAPKINKFNDNSCYNNQQIFKLKDIWNKNNPNNLIYTNNSNKIWKFLKNNLHSKCYNELCWLNKLNIKDKNIIKNKNFRPFSPKEWNVHPYTWLSSEEIIQVMRQYENKYNKFKFIGPSPIDFDDNKLYGSCVYEELCKFNIEKYYNSRPRKSKIGIIFNLDPHYKSGSHWIALFIDLDKNFIFYFDSNGEKIPKRINILVNRILYQSQKINLNLTFFSNEGMEHQKRDGQCGMYTLYFIIELLKENKDYLFFKNNRVPDTLMKDYRIKYFNKTIE